MTTLSGGPTFATMVRIHRGATYVLTALVVGHVLLVSGLLPGYRGAWRAMVTGRVTGDGAPALAARRRARAGSVIGHTGPRHAGGRRDEHRRGGADARRGARARPPLRRRVPTDLLVLAALAVPFVVAALVLRRPSWFAIDDYALIEMRVRDVASSHPPLVGLGGRIEHDGVPGSHPGPLAF